MVQSRVTLCQVKYRRTFSAGYNLGRTCGEGSRQLCSAKCYLWATDFEPGPTLSLKKIVSACKDGAYRVRVPLGRLSSERVTNSIAEIIANRGQTAQDRAA